MPRLKFTTFDGVTHTHELKLGTTRIGRTPDNDLQIDELELSSHHCALRWEGEAIILQDLDSAGGTYVDGQPIAVVEVKVGQVISMGSFLLRLEPSTGELAGSPEAELKPVQLPDGSYSCLRHHTKRASYECEHCFDLACEECVRLVDRPGSLTESFCRNCGAVIRLVDWSRLDMSKKELLKEWLIPKTVKHAIDFWAKHSGKLRSKND